MLGLFKSEKSKSSKSSKKSSSKRYEEPEYPTNFTPDFAMRAGQTYDASHRFQPDFVMRHGQTYDVSQPIYANTRPIVAPVPEPEPTMYYPTAGNAFFPDMSSTGPSLSRSNAVHHRSTSSRYRENSGYPPNSFVPRSEASSSRSHRSHRSGHSSSSASPSQDCEIQRWYTCREH
ncbi:MAG: hypothetical protein STHCBS139747_007902 [Sporothrix thermara]